MLSKLLSLIIFTTVSVIISATSFNSALDISSETICSVRRASIGRFFIDTSEEGRVIVSVHCRENLDYTLNTVSQDFNNMTGKLPKGIIDFLNTHKNQYLQNLLRSTSQDSQLTTEFIFTGYNHGGRIALVLSALWADEFNKTHGKKLKPNQIKSITFSATAFGDGEFNRSIKKLLGEENIIDFSSYYSTPIRCGIPIQILPDEQFIDSLKNGSYNGFIKAGVSFGILAYSYFLLNDLVLTSDKFIGAAGSLINQDEKCIANNDYTFWRDNFVKARDRIKFLFSYSFLLLFPTIYEMYHSYRFVPSERLVLEAFKYTQDNYHANEEASLDSIGCPPLISARRGIGKVSKWIIGI